MLRSLRKYLFHPVVLIVLLGLGGCATIVRNGVPLGLMDEARISGVDDVRAWGDEPLKNASQLAQIRLRQINKTRPEFLRPDKQRIVSFLALTGGGADGAFGAGFLKGWTASRRRPEFEVVTGVSTGALIAPFAFLGSRYDDELEEIFTQYSTSDLLSLNVLAGLFGGSALSNSTPMFKLISKYIDRKFMAEVAHQHLRGRRLLIGTTNLDAERPVIWNMGRIAIRNTPKALKLFRKVILASASIPGVFPPVYIDVEADGLPHREMHVDGGTTNNIFLLPEHFDVKKFIPSVAGRTNLRLYIIVNSHVQPQPKVIEATTYSIAERSISTLIKQQTAGDLLRLYVESQQNRIDYNMAAVPADFNEVSKEAFDKDYMGKLYAVGYNAAAKGYKWRRQPPD